MKKWLVSLLLFIGCSCSSNESKICTTETPLAKVGNEVITVGYYKKFKSNLAPSYRKKFPSDKELLKAIINERLVLLDSLENGIFKKPEIKKKIMHFKIRYLAYKFVNTKIGNIHISDEEIKEFVKKHPTIKIITPELKHKIEVNLKAEKFQKKRQEILENIGSEISFLNKQPSSPEDTVAIYRGKKIYFKNIEPLIKKPMTSKKVEKAVLEYILYQKALKEKLDRDEDFQSIYNRLLTNIAVKEFEKKILSSVKVTDKEVKAYYKEHKNLLKRPPTAEVVIYEFKNKKEAEKALEKLKHKPFLNSNLENGKTWRVSAVDADNNPVSALVFKRKKNLGIISLPDGRALLVLVTRRFPEKELLYGDAYPLIKKKLTFQKAEKIAEEEIKRLEKKYGVVYYKKNLACLSLQSTSHHK